MECLIDNDHYESIYFTDFKNEKTKSLDAQICEECGDTIHPGTEYWYATGQHDIEDDDVDDVTTTIFAAVTCKICEGLRRFLCYRSYSCLYDDLYEGILNCNDPYEIENHILISVSYTELQWLLRFDVLNLDNDMDNDED